MEKHIEEMIALAQQALTHAHCPYSNFSVGCCILDNNNAYHIGCNVENSAYPLCCCAEPGAISQMVVNGGTKIKALVLVNGLGTTCSPCGGCRQRISEFSDENTKIYLCNNSGILETYTMAELLPHSFNAKTMEK